MAAAVTDSTIKILSCSPARQVHSVTDCRSFVGAVAVVSRLAARYGRSPSIRKLRDSRGCIVATVVEAVLPTRGGYTLVSALEVRE